MEEEFLEQFQAMNNQLQSINATLELIVQKLGAPSTDALIADLADGLASQLASFHIPE